jgi:xanthine dehydrogenase YagS FAD-binding subunit
MRAFRLHQPESVDDAVGLLARFGIDGRPLGGGTDLVAGVMRDQLIGSAMPYPTDLIDIARLRELRGIRVDTDGSLVIGSATTLTDIAESPEVRGAWPLLASAASLVATPEIRNVGTLGGNLHQRPRCWFFRNKDFDCIKKGGSICYAVKGDNRYNAILDGNVCFIVHPSDLGSALIALGAMARVAGPRGEPVISFDDYFVSPAQNLVAETALAPDELLVEVTVPPVAAGARQTWRKVNEKGLPTWDFAIASVATVAVVRDGVWHEGRVVLGAVAPVPWRALVVEEALAGRKLEDAVPDAVAALRAAARPMTRNAWKLDVMAAVLERTLLDLAAS